MKKYLGHLQLDAISPGGRDITIQDSHGVGKAKTILLAEDEPKLREVFRRFLERAGFSLLVAEDGREALRIACQYPDHVDLLVSNVRMPGMTGPDLARALRQSRPDLRVLFVSAYPQGMLTLDKDWEFLQKPFTAQALLDIVYELLSLRSSPSTQPL